MVSLLNVLPQTGIVRWLSIRPQRLMPVQVVSEVTADPDQGLLGDHYSGRNGKRQVTLIQEEHLEVVGKWLNTDPVDPAQTRRNMVIAGLNLQALRGRQFQVGAQVILEMTGDCHPCSRMDMNLGPGGFQAMRGHGGITARVVQGGLIRLGDTVQLVANAVGQADSLPDLFS
ncbi:MAG: MOSC domain-containing protein [Lewinellaceae bacterium]|nr:MOSC domain-containing protein [Lewinellaceae bacterium]